MVGCLFQDQFWSQRMLAKVEPFLSFPQNRNLKKKVTTDPENVTKIISYLLVLLESADLAILLI